MARVCVCVEQCCLINERQTVLDVIGTRYLYVTTIVSVCHPLFDDLRRICQLLWQQQQNPEVLLYWGL